jgi:type III secretion system YscJ/HrcJ family lipoprotein
MSHQKLKNWIFIFLISFGLMACGQSVLLEGLSQHDVNEVMVMLSKHGIKAGKESITQQQETTWSVKVSSDDEERARNLLIENRLPRVNHAGLLGICKETSMIPTPMMEKCQQMLALKGEIINALTKLPGVVSADVVLNIPEEDTFAGPDDPKKRPTASVVVEMGARAGPSLLTEAKIQHFVANTVTDMDPRDVAVIISLPESFESDNRKTKVDLKSAPTIPEVASNPNNPNQTEMVYVLGLELNPESAKKFKIIAIILLVFFIFLSVGIIMLIFKMSKLRQKVPDEALDINPMGGGSSMQALPEQADMDRLVEDTQAD